MDVLEANEAIEETDGRFNFAGTLVVYQVNNEVYHAVLKTRYSSPSDVRPELLEKVIRIPKSAFSHPFSTKFARAPEPLPVNSYVKKPPLISHDRICQGPQPNSIADSVIMEAEICELLMKHDHPNVATYLGCQVP